ncbi:MAG: hypothetical protein SFU56_16100 [Capsulimonadales bacterium]|nr:hypothetical protein [Capsulimonadales bacterium]
MPLEMIAWGAIPVVGICIAAGIHRRVRAERDARLGSFRSFRRTVETIHRQQNDLLQQAMQDARHSLH